MNLSSGPSERKFTGEIRRFDEMQHYLRFFRAHLVKADITSKDDTTVSVISFQGLKIKFDLLGNPSVNTAIVWNYSNNNKMQ
jgi:5'(3')-deoxyribonucleotidase